MRFHSVLLFWLLPAVVGLAGGCHQQPPQNQPTTKPDELSAGRGTLSAVPPQAIPPHVFNRYRAEMPTTPPAAVFRYERAAQPVYLFVVERKSDRQWLALDINAEGQSFQPMQPLSTAPALPETQPALNAE